MKLTASALIVCVFAAAATTNAAILYVNPTPAGPNDYATFQAAIDAATDGDEILVYDGTYTGVGNVNIDFNGKAVSLESINGYQNVSINCGGADGTRAFIFQSGETPATILSGITIRNGNIQSGNGGGISIAAG